LNLDLNRFYISFPIWQEKIITPFVQFATAISVTNEGNLAESLKLIFEKEAYSIECKWDRLILLSEGNLNNFLSSNSTPIEILNLAISFNIREGERI
jgi:hypothetical protein